MYRRNRTRTDSGRFTPSFNTLSESSDESSENISSRKKYHRSEPASPLFHRVSKSNLSRIDSAIFSETQSRNSISSQSSIDNPVFPSPPSLIITQSYEDTTKDLKTKQHLIKLPKLPKTTVENLEFQVTMIGFDQILAKVFDKDGKLIAETKKLGIDWDFSTRRTCYKKFSMISCTSEVFDEKGVEMMVLDLWMPQTH